MLGCWGKNLEHQYSHVNPPTEMSLTVLCLLILSKMSNIRNVSPPSIEIGPNAPMIDPMRGGVLY